MIINMCLIYKNIIYYIIIFLIQYIYIYIYDYQNEILKIVIFWFKNH